MGLQAIKALYVSTKEYLMKLEMNSIAMIKLAYRHGMHCEIDVIEIPKFFFDEEVCSIDNTEIKIPFFDDALEQLKKLGIMDDDNNSLFSDWKSGERSPIKVSLIMMAGITVLTILMVMQ